jgi:hypothetical protein
MIPRPLRGVITLIAFGVWFVFFILVTLVANGVFNYYGNSVILCISFVFTMVFMLLFIQLIKVLFFNR